MISIYPGTVADNIRYGPQLKGKKLTDDEVYKLLSLADLDSSFYKKTSNELSVGQAQRVALARTLANEPEVMPIEMCKISIPLHCVFVPPNFFHALAKSAFSWPIYTVLLIIFCVLKGFVTG